MDATKLLFIRAAAHGFFLLMMLIMIMLPRLIHLAASI